MYEFTYQRADTLGDAKTKLGSGDDPKLLAGGQTILPTMKQRLASPSHLIDIGNLSELQNISVESGHVTIGAGVKHADVASSAEIKSAIPGLAALAGEIGDPHVRHMGTLGGSIANNDPASDYPAACLGLGATIITDTREISADDFFTGMFETALGDDEIITAVRFPKPEKSGYMKFPNPASRYAVVGVFIAQHGNGVKVAVTGAAPCVFRWSEAETALNSKLSADAISSLTVPASDMNSDLHASAEYRAHLVGVMARRAIDILS